MNILDQLADHARERVAEAKETLSRWRRCRQRAVALPKGDFCL